MRRLSSLDFAIHQFEQAIATILTLGSYGEGAKRTIDQLQKMHDTLEDELECKNMPAMKAMLASFIEALKSEGK